MHLTYRGRMIAYNIAIFLLLFCIILFCVVQGTIFVSIVNAEKDLFQIKKDSDLYITQSLSANQNHQDPAVLFSKNADKYASYLAEVENQHIFFYDEKQNMIADSSLHTETNLSDSLARLNTDNNPVFQYRVNGGVTSLYYLSPIFYGNNHIGYMGCQYNMQKMDSLLSDIILYYCLAGLAGFCILIVVTLSYADHFTGPIKELTQIAGEINNENYDAFIYYKRNDEIGALTDAFNTMTQNINRVIKQLNTERNRLASVLASLDDGVLAIDQKGNIITSNAYIKKYFNVNNPKTIYDFQYQSFLRDMYDDLRNGKTHVSEEIDCNSRNLMIIGSPISDSGLEENYLIIIRNITADKQFESEQKKFISSVSHELRTPLTTIIGYTDMLMRRNVTNPDMLNKSLTTINHEGYRLLRLVDDLLNANRLDKTEFEVHRTNLDLRALISNVIEQMQFKAVAKEIVINYKYDDTIPEVLGDYDRLQQLFINIFHNAIKYSDVGDIIDVVSTLENNMMVTSVRDYGVGMSESEQIHIFDAFYRVDEDRARSNGEGGAGLGLYLVKQIVDKHDGTITIDSVPDEGTNVTVKIPVINVGNTANKGDVS